MTSSKRNWQTLQQQTFDVLIVGGGISGAWIAMHCAQQGLNTLLIEKGDYASQTSSSSSKLLHGGIRYLQQMQFGKVRESALERSEYVYAAPHMSVPVPFAVPTYPDFKRSKFFLNCGMLAYRLLCVGEGRVLDSKEQALPPIRSISATELNQICDLSNQAHTGAVVLYERHMLDSERMVLAILQTAQKHGAQTYNYLSAQEFLLDADRVVGVKVKDELGTDEFIISAKLVINAAGPWIDNLNGDLRSAQEAPSINGFSVGSHIVTRQICDHAIAVTTQHQSDAKIDRGGRHVFAIPWRGYSLIGTSYDEIDSPNGEVKLEAHHVDQLIDAINEGIPSAKLTREDLVSGFCGLLPLRTDNIDRTVYQGSGEYQIIDHAKSNHVEGLVTALGAKYTTGRKLSALTMKLVCQKLGVENSLSRTKLSSSDYTHLGNFIDSKVKQYKDTFCAETVRHLVSVYGSDIDDFVARIIDDNNLTKPISAQQLDIFGQVVWAMENEQALTLSDVLYNRTSLGLLGIQDSEIGEVAKLMADAAGWTEEKLSREVESVRYKLQETHNTLQSITER